MKKVGWDLSVLVPPGRATYVLVLGYHEDDEGTL